MIQAVPPSIPPPMPMNQNLDACRVRTNVSLIDAMRALEAGGIAIALVMDDNHRLVGVVTDGDMRRAIISGAKPSDPLAPFVKHGFVRVSPEMSRVEVLELMQARRIEHLPVLDADGRMVGLHLLHNVLGQVERPNCAVIMAGGKGMRLRPITENVPKPMIHVAGRPILERIVLQLVGAGIHKIYLAINYLGHMIERHFESGEKFGCSIEYLREERALGTGGALRLLPTMPTHPLVVMNGDLVTQADIGQLIDFHELQLEAAAATIGVRKYFHAVPFGCVEMDGDQVTRFEEKPDVVKMVNTGIYVVSPHLIPRIPPDVEYGLPALIEEARLRGEKICALEIQDDWIDVGQRDQLKRAREGE